MKKKIVRRKKTKSLLDRDEQTHTTQTICAIRRAARVPTVMPVHHSAALSFDRALSTAVSRGMRARSRRQPRARPPVDATTRVQQRSHRSLNRQTTTMFDHRAMHSSTLSLKTTTKQKNITKTKKKTNKQITIKQRKKSFSKTVNKLLTNDSLRARNAIMARCSNVNAVRSANVAP